MKANVMSVPSPSICANLPADLLELRTFSYPPHWRHFLTLSTFNVFENIITHLSIIQSECFVKVPKSSDCCVQQ